MNRQEIIAMAEECGLTDKDLGPGMTDYGNATEAILKFAARIAAKEREECAKLCEFLAEETLAMKTPHMNNILQIVTDKLADAAKDCAEEIRARGQL